MSLQYPRYDLTEFGGLNKDLGGVFAHVKYLEIEGRISNLKSQIQEILSLPPSGIALMDEIQTVMLRIMSRMHKKEDRPNVLDGLRREFLDVCQKTSLPTDQLEEAKERVVRNIMNLYFGFNIKDFETDYQEIFFDECTNQSTPAKLKKLKESLAKVEAEAANSDWKKTDPKQWFAMVPARFRDRRVHPGFTREQMARFVIETFVTEWRHRAVKFAVPVSITGVSIATMPRGMGDVWMKAYKALGLDKLELRGLYIPRPCDIQEQRVAPPVSAKIPAVFQPSGK